MYICLYMYVCHKCQRLDWICMICRLFWGRVVHKCQTLDCMTAQVSYCTKTTQVFFGHVFFSVTETDETIKIYKEYSKMD